MPSDHEDAQPPTWLLGGDEQADTTTPATNGSRCTTAPASAPLHNHREAAKGTSDVPVQPANGTTSARTGNPVPAVPQPSGPTSNLDTPRQPTSFDSLSPAPAVTTPAPAPTPPVSPIFRPPAAAAESDPAAHQAEPLRGRQRTADVLAGGDPPAGFVHPASAPQEAPPQRQQSDFRTAAPSQRISSIEDLDIIKRAKRPPERGVGKLLYKVSGGKINTGQSPAELEHQELVRRVNHPVRGVYKIAFVSLKGGVGKTTAAMTLGSTFACHRGDRVVAIDANPDLGTLADRDRREHRHTVRDLLADENIRSYSDVRAYTSQGESRLEILASEEDPETSESFNEQDYLDTLRILEVHYNLVLTDCGTGIMHSAMHGVLSEADALVVVSPTARDGARSAEATLNWLSKHGYQNLVERTVVVINSTRPGASPLDLDRLTQLFRDRGVRAVRTLPYDDHLGEGGTIDLKLLNKKTARAYLELAADLADDFPEPLGRHVRN